MKLLHGEQFNPGVNLLDLKAPLILSAVNTVNLLKPFLNVVLSMAVALAPVAAYSNGGNGSSKKDRRAASEGPETVKFDYTDPETGEVYESELTIFDVDTKDDVRKANRWFKAYKRKHGGKNTDQVPLVSVHEGEDGLIDEVYSELEDTVPVDELELEPGMMADLQDRLAENESALLEDQVTSDNKQSLWQKFRTSMAGFMENNPWKFRGSLAFLRFMGVSAASVYSAVYFSGLPLGPALAVGLGWYGLFTFGIQMRTDIYSWAINNLSLSSAVRAIPSFFKKGQSYVASYKSFLEKNKKNIPVSIADKLNVFNLTEIPVLGIGALLYWVFLGEPLYDGAWESFKNIMTGTAMATVAQGIFDVSVSTKDEKRENEITDKILASDVKEEIDALRTDLQMSKLGSAAKFFFIGVLANFAVLLYSTATSTMGNPEFLPLSVAMVAGLGLAASWDLLDAYADKSPALMKIRNTLSAPFRKIKNGCNALFSSKKD